MACGEGAEQGEARHLADQTDARRQGIRQPVAYAHARHRALCRDDRAAISHGGETARPQPGTHAARDESLPPPAQIGGPAEAAVRLAHQGKKAQRRGRGGCAEVAEKLLTRFARRRRALIYRVHCETSAPTALSLLFVVVCSEAGITACE